MDSMGRKRKIDLGLEPRVYFNHGAYYYAHREPPWEHLGRDKDKANEKARLYNDPAGRYGTMVYWLDMFLADCERRVKLKSTVKGIKLSERTLQDYRDAIGTEDKPTALRIFLKPPLTPSGVTPDMAQEFLRVNAEAGRAVRANRDKACWSSCMGWLLREKKVPGLMVNPLLRGSGVQRNPEAKRTRYVTHDEYRDVWAVASRAERLLMELTYRSLQRPESDIILWDTRVVVTRPTGRQLVFKQHKTGRDMVINMDGELDELIPRPTAGKVVPMVQPLVARLDGGFYTYSGLCSMLSESIKTANVRRKARNLSPMKSFGYRDLKGKGATDMWLAGTPVEDIQALLGHASKTTTEIYVKQRWVESVQPNRTVMA